MLKDEYRPLHGTFGKRRSSPANEIHKAYNRAVWRRGGILKRTLFLAFSLLWPMKAALFALSRTIRHGRAIRESHGLSLTAQYFGQISLAICSNIPPRAYYLYRLYEATNHDMAADYIHHHEIIELLPSGAGDDDAAKLRNKHWFFETCRKRGLPTIPVLIYFDSGKAEWVANGEERLPHSDLISKPVLGRCGVGVESWAYLTDGHYREKESAELSPPDLISWLSKASCATPYILQEKVGNHPKLAGLSRGGLCTVRLVTCRDVMAPPEYLSAVFRMPTGASITDNFDGGGLASPVQKDDGVLGPAIAKSLDSTPLDIHPNTGTRVRGVKIPFWEQIVRLCLDAHEAFPTLCSVGWDVAVTENGPLLVEGNSTWCVELMQRPHNTPLGRTQLAKILPRYARARMLLSECQDNPLRRYS